ncbi:MAG: hypothetical protein D8M57_09960 [Candidatus Scalindua sp. AMX11]|nr:MAG: hypothetical protein DWQ00_08710 [Candidatus Scalindua sp.]NOG84868.1 hypothetical protein [Planctomycetota bacterium]RZV84937.1 MAG: hypothetical protein EX341_07985 [Candidatus Scalindua sp. SCAELEC01]TDE65070.1 MAG: hypothetical protein D8M57_09960 [Candidatus Scalindua sp. AMX11]GJQ59462.1 MAG: hypothetical protein SCALA701_22630 [Candidatus Scalindua sp.]
MFFKPLILTIFFPLSLFIISGVFLSDKSVAGEIKQEAETLSAGSPGDFTIDTPLPENDLYHLEIGMARNVDTALFPKLFLQYISDCKRLKQEKRAIAFFRDLSNGKNQPSPHTLTTKGVITYGWNAEKTLRAGLQKIDEAISIDREAFFPHLCRASYLAYLPERYPEAIEQFYLLIEKEKHNRSHLEDIYKNLSRIYREHGHYAMARNTDKKLQLLQDQMHDNFESEHTTLPLPDRGKKCEEMVHFPYPIINNTTFIGRVSTAKDRRLDIHLSILESYMERKHSDEVFSTMFTRYVMLAWQYQETLRAIKFFETLLDHHPHSPNVLAAVGTITYGWRGQTLLQEGLRCVEKATRLKSKDLFSKMHYATFISYFPNGFQRSMREFSLLKQEARDSPKSLDMINYHINCIRQHHGYDSEQIVEFNTPGTRQWS